MEKVVVSMLIRNSENYIPFFEKQMKLLENTNPEYHFSYVFYTNNNTDNTLNLLNKLPGKVEVYEKNLSKDLLNCQRTIRLAILRQELLEIVREKDLDYCLMLDDEVFFNGAIFKTLINKMKKHKIHACGANTLHNTIYSCYYDFFAYKKLNGKTLNYKDFLSFKPFHYINLSTWLEHIKFMKKNILNEDILMEVLSCFGGFYLLSSEIIKNKNINYIENKNDIGKTFKEECEHFKFNNQITQNGYKIYINFESQPIYTSYVKPDNQKKVYQKIMKRVEKNNSRNNKIINLVTVLVPLTLLFIYKISKKSFYVSILLSVFLFTLTNFYHNSIS